jgi:DUF1707 SHOCT-like domain
MTEDGDGPRPVPSLLPETHVTDEERNRYGLLLDRAAERGLISPYDYEVRLRDLAEATSIEQMNRLVTELPAFTSAPTAVRSSSRRGWRAATLSGGVAPTTSRSRSSPWLLLVIVVVVMIVSLVVLGIVAAHVAHSHNSGSGLAPPMRATRALSALRL